MTIRWHRRSFGRRWRGPTNSANLFGTPDQTEDHAPPRAVVRHRVGADHVSLEEQLCVGKLCHFGNMGILASDVPNTLVRLVRPCRRWADELLTGSPTHRRRLVTVRGEPIPKYPLPLGEGWGEGKQSSESIENTSSDLIYPHPRPLSRRTREGRLWDKL